MRRESVLLACVVATVLALVAPPVTAGARPATRVTLHNVHPSITTREQPEFTFRAYHLRPGSRIVLQESRRKAWKTILQTRKVSYRAHGWFRLGRPATAGRERYRVVVVRKGTTEAVSPVRVVKVRAAKA